MTTIAEQFAKLAEADWLVWSNEHRAWWRPESAGYTNHIEAAGRYTFEAALSCCCGRDRQENGTPSEMPVPAPESYDRHRTTLAVGLSALAASQREVEMLKAKMADLTRASASSVTQNSAGEGLIGGLTEGEWMLEGFYKDSTHG